MWNKHSFVSCDIFVHKDFLCFQNQIPLRVIFAIVSDGSVVSITSTTTHLEVQVLVLTLVLMLTLTLWLVTELGLVVAFVSAMA